MNTAILLILIAILPLHGDTIFSQDHSLHESISAEAEKEIIEAVFQTIATYEESGNFWNEGLGQFDNEKYLIFIALFSGQAEIIDDLTWSRESLPYSQYAQLAFENLQDVGVTFDLEEISITKIDVDESGFYVVDVQLSKRLYSGINSKGKAVRLKRGRKINLEMRIDLPDYLISDARIQYIQEQKPKKWIDYIAMPAKYISDKLTHQ